MIWIDDSQSMETEQEGLRIETLKKTISEITAIYDLASPTGIRSLKFLNSNSGLRNIRSTNWKKRFDDHDYRGMTRIGTALKQKILNKFVFGTQMEKPLLIILITDGEVRLPQSVAMDRTNNLLDPRRRANAMESWRML